MFSSAVANKQLRSFWMSSSQRLQQRLPLWSDFPLSVSRDLFSQALTALQMLLIESPAAPALKCRQMKTKRTGEHKPCVRRHGDLLGVYLHPQSLTNSHICPFSIVILSRSLGSISVDWLSFALSLDFGVEYPVTAISYAEGVGVCPPLRKQYL